MKIMVTESRSIAIISHLASSMLLSSSKEELIKEKIEKDTGITINKERSKLENRVGGKIGHQNHLSLTR